MSKLNKPMAAKKARQSRQFRNSEINSNGVYQPLYSQGMDAWINGHKFCTTWHPHKKAGYRKARDRDIAFASASNEKYPNGCRAAQERVLARLSQSA